MTRLLLGDCRELLATLDAESVDAIVCDPPYELGFMGKGWDRSGVAFDAATWAACLRVAKPGAHLVAFGGTRTAHRLAVAIEDAGWEIRDTVAWCYWSGFPKSLDVSKAMDGSDKAEESRRRSLTFTAWMRSTGITAAAINDATASFMGSHYLTDRTQPAVAVASLFDLLRPLLPSVPPEIESLVRERTIESENMKQREVTGMGRSGIATGETGRHTIGGSFSVDFPITAPATDLARQWNGWGTALKPAFEPAILARKPLRETSIARQVAATGTGALNIDACRFAPGDPMWPGPDGEVGSYPNTLGRFPANLIHTPKASREERELGCEGLPVRTGAEQAEREEGSAGLQSPRSGAIGNKSDGVRNWHPTVKPLHLMRWLVRLVTPPGGVVLDPFMGSGTTGMAAAGQGFRFVGCELDADHLQIARARIEWAAGGGVACDLDDVRTPNPQPELFR